jgi:penicillin-binding protein 2
MPLDPAQDRRPPVTPQMALRVAGIGVLAFALFGIIFFRLWYLQVLDGDKYLAQARENRVRTERIHAPRGQIVDRTGTVMVDNRLATVVSIDPATIPQDMRSAMSAWGQQMTRRAAVIKRKGHPGPPPPVPQPDPEFHKVYSRLARVLKVSVKTINKRVVSAYIQVPYADIRVAADVDAAQRNYLAEHRELFPGVKVAQTFLRAFPYKTTAAQLIGVTGEISDQQLKDKKHYKGIKAGTFIGKNGLEARYDRYLRGRDGTYRIEVNAAGERRRGVTARDPRQGRELQLTLDLGLQEAGEKALKTAGNGNPGAFVAMNPLNGDVYAMGSLPSYNPRELAGPFSSPQAYNAKFGEAAGSPLTDRAFQSVYPTGSIFKPITALAAMSAGVMQPQDVFDDAGCLDTGARKGIDVACNTGKKANGPVNLKKALQVSSDVYFYNLGLKMYGAGSPALQTWARRLGLGRPTTVDLPYEATGTIPGPAWLERIKRAELQCRRKEHKKNCFIADPSAQWNPGDEVNTSVGQGSVQASPLQMAVAYSTIINGGTVPRPHLGQEVADSRGIVEALRPPASRHVKGIRPEWRQAIMDGLFAAANENGGTSKPVFDQGWPRNRFPIFGKTGTAERGINHRDQSWYVAYSYAGDPKIKPIVVVCTVEEGGFGAASAAPAARLILSKWFGVPPKLVRGSSTDR